MESCAGYTSTRLLPLWLPVDELIQALEFSQPEFVEVF
jgi:hypothetical protein